MNDPYLAKLNEIIEKLGIIEKKLDLPIELVPVERKTVYEWTRPMEQVIAAEQAKHIALGAEELARDVLVCQRAAQYGVSWAGTFLDPSEVSRAWDCVAAHILGLTKESDYLAGPFGQCHPDMAIYALLTGVVPYKPAPFIPWEGQIKKVQGITLEDWLAKQWGNTATPSGGDR